MAEEDILREIGSISRALDSIANIEFKDLELNRGQYLYLTRVFEHPGIISDHLATLLNIDRTTTARGIRKLERAGLIFKEDDETNKKIKHLFVTNTGKKLAKEIERENVYSNTLVRWTGSITKVSKRSREKCTWKLEFCKEWRQEEVLIWR